MQLLRYLINGVVATAVHYSVFIFNLKVFNIQSAGIANLLAAIFGICASFIGNRYYVFRIKDDHVYKQWFKFVLLYFTIALLHGLILFWWTDFLRLDYKVGFLIATIIQFSLSFFGNKILVFNNENK
jgi:putative flippase GtrA